MHTCLAIIRLVLPMEFVLPRQQYSTLKRIRGMRFDVNDSLVMKNAFAYAFMFLQCISNGVVAAIDDSFFSMLRNTYSNNCVHA